MEDIIEKILVDTDEIENICKKLAKRINEDYKGREVVFVGLLKGCIPFYAKLVSYIDLKIEMDFMDVSSYEGVNNTNEVKVRYDLGYPLTGKHILIVEDIVDTGQTLNKIVNLLKSRNAESVEVVTMLDKVDGRTVPFEAKYVGKVIPNEFVIGFGLDYYEKYRNLPYVGVLKKEVYNN